MKKNIYHNVNYLRLSITDWCNLNCIYCTPLEKKQFLSHSDVLRYEEIERLVRIFGDLGITRVRITGGEPLLKRGAVDLVKMLSKIGTVEELSMTTNGVFLKELAGPLKDAGLDRINISLDTLKRERFFKICGKDEFDKVWNGIEEALKCGLDPVKLNIVPMQGINEDEVADFARLTLKYPLSVRFIEFFHTNFRSQKLLGSLINSAQTKKIISNALGRLSPENCAAGNGPAEYYTLPGAKGAIGFISGSTDNFCAECSRIRVDCAGRISPCLFSGHVYDLRHLLRDNASNEQIKDKIKEVLSLKPNYTKDCVQERNTEMSSLGG